MDWKDNFTLINADIDKSPGDFSMQYKAGLELQNKYDTESDSEKRKQINAESIAHLLSSIQLKPDYTESHSDIGVAYLRVKNYDSAEFHFKRALELNPDHFNASINLGTLFFEKQQFRDAIFYYQNAVHIYSNTDVAWYNMGICYARVGQLDSSVVCMKKVIEIAPAFDNYKSFGNVAISYKMIGKMDSAAKYEQLMRQYFPGFDLSKINTASH